MNILYLGPENNNIQKFLTSDGHQVYRMEDPICMDDVKNKDFIISYGFRHLIGLELVRAIRYKAINLHISFLPWNRGADPNLWSFLENTPKGVSIHYIDEGLDTGEIIVQQSISYDEKDTLRTTYERLKCSIEKLFFEYWPSIRDGNVQMVSQSKSEGTYHRSLEKEKYAHLLLAGWDTRVEELLGKCRLSAVK